MKPLKYYMKIALKEGKKGKNLVSPNPLVGAVVVDPLSGEVISKGYHRAYGKPHAEVEALKKAGERAKGALLFVTLEPCNHYGKTPPCTQAILKAGIKEVICGIRDPNPKAKGGLEFLREKGVEVKSGVLAKECTILTRFFLSRILRGSPWVILKVASSLDGKISVSTGDSKWITCEKARAFAHKLRSECDAILVGKNTVLKDDPQLTCRLVKGKNPLRIVLDTRLSLSPSFKIFDTEPAPTVIACGENAPQEKEKAFLKKGVEVWRLPLKNGRVDLFSLMKKCGEKKISSLLVEGGGTIHGAFLSEGLVDEVYYGIGPVIIGDPQGTPSISGRVLSSLKEAHFLFELKARKIGKSYFFHGYTERGYSSLKDWALSLSSFSAS